MDKVSTEAAYTTKEGINNVYLYTCHLLKTGTAMDQEASTATSLRQQHTFL